VFADAKAAALRALARRPQRRIGQAEALTIELGVEFTSPLVDYYILTV
jgi:hypothetical protein